MKIIKRENNEFYINFAEVIRLLIGKSVIIILCSLICGALMYGETYYFVTPQYQAEVTMYVNNRANGESNGMVTQSDLNASAQLVKTYAAIIKNVSVLDSVIEECGIGMSTEALKSRVSVTSVNGTEVFEVKVTAEDPELAAEIANTIAKIAPDKIGEIVFGSSVKVINYAKVPTHISSPDYKRRTVMGMGIGFIASIIIILYLELMNTLIVSEKEFEQWNYPILGVVPDLKTTKK